MMHEKKHKQSRKHAAKPVEDAVNVFRKEGREDILSDILGSYTGTAADGGVPEQDADDL